ncbi:AAEL010406-PA [Aedes aegypti]|uniref:AAEL010406-PA n=1 Tax=Aedes aegypti TaxID=7159 RepID=Q16T30_AEDAE|nr:AAEL010406-PA [Aedes aegypti]
MDVLSTAGDVERRIAQRMDFLRAKFGNIRLQPQIVAIGPSRKESAVMVLFGGAEYKADNVLHAICICMHVTYVLSLEYTPDCKPLWLFIQTYLFKIKASIVELPKSTRDLLQSIE